MSSPYQLLHLEPGRGQIRFDGRFEDRDVTWEATIVCVPATEPQFIDIGEAATVASLHRGPRLAPIGETVGDCRPVTIGLHVDRIDEAVLHKTVIMIRQYKRLRRGRYRFG